MNLAQLLNLSKQGYSDREIAQLLGIDRKTVARYRKKNDEYQKLLAKEPQNRDLREEYIAFISGEQKYQGSTRPTRRYTSEMDARVRQILEEDEIRRKALNLPPSRKISARQIYEILLEENYKISYSTVSHKVAALRNSRPKEAYIRMSFPPGQVAQYDYGFIEIKVKGETKTRFSIAVIVLPCSGFTWAYVYRNQKSDTFLDSHVRFFERIQGVPERMIYDNMKNVVARFVGKNGKEYSSTILNLSAYYGFSAVTTNAYSGNEKGKVERNVQWIRDRLFTRNWEFDSFEEIQEYMDIQLEKLNAQAGLEAEREFLLPLKERYETAEILQPKVDKYSTITVDRVRYSVPDHLVGKELTVKLYPDCLYVYSANIKVAEHNRVFVSSPKEDRWVIDHRHYLSTLQKKPGSLRNSRIFVEWPGLKTICEDYFNSDYRKFIAFLQDNAHLPVEALLERARQIHRMKLDHQALPAPEKTTQLSRKTQDQIQKAQLNFIGRKEGEDHES